MGFFDDRRRRFGVHRVEHQHFGALGQRRFALALLLFSVAAGVEVADRATGALCLHRFFEIRFVVGFVARRFVFRQQQRDLQAAAATPFGTRFATPAGGAAGGAAATTATRGNRRDRDARDGREHDSLDRRTGHLASSFGCPVTAATVPAMQTP